MQNLDRNKESNVTVTIYHEHKCECISHAPAMAEGRSWWIGKLLEPVPDFPEESFCLHLQTKIKNVTFLCNEADFRNIIVMCAAAIGLPDIDWLHSMIDLAKVKHETNE